MYIHNKLLKKNNIEYYLCKNTATSKYYTIMCYKLEKGKPVESDVVAWISKSKLIEYNTDTGIKYDKNTIIKIALHNI